MGRGGGRVLAWAVGWLNNFASCGSSASALRLPCGHSRQPQDQSSQLEKVETAATFQQRHGN